MEIMKILAVILIGLAFLSLLRQYLPAVSPLASIGVIIVLMLFVLPILSNIAGEVREFCLKLGLGDGVIVVFKVLAATTIGKITGELCRDNNERALGMVSELAGIVTAVVCAIPLLLWALRLVGGGM